MHTLHARFALALPPTKKIPAEIEMYCSLSTNTPPPPLVRRQRLPTFSTSKRSPLSRLCDPWPCKLDVLKGFRIFGPCLFLVQHLIPLLECRVGLEQALECRDCLKCSVRLGVCSFAPQLYDAKVRVRKARSQRRQFGNSISHDCLKDRLYPLAQPLQTLEEAQRYWSILLHHGEQEEKHQLTGSREQSNVAHVHKTIRPKRGNVEGWLERSG